MELKDISTKEEMFNFAVGKLLKQNCKSHSSDASNGETCMYRGKNNTKCIAGHLLADEHFDEQQMESEKVSLPPVLDAIKKSLPNLKIGQKETDLLTSMQVVHDTDEVVEWKDSFKSVARIYKLNYAPMEF